MHKKITISLIIIILFLLIANKTSMANDAYKIIIEDDANLLTEVEETELSKQMTPLTEYGNVMFKTTNSATGSGTSLKYIQNYYYSKLQNQSGVAFYIDMNQRQVCACATGGLDKIITSGKCDSIMDNVYMYARSQNYYKCASQTFLQMSNLLKGGKIAESMKYICNAIVAIMVALFGSYGFFMIFTQSKKASKQELIEECEVSFEHTPIITKKIGEHRVYSPVSDNSSSGGSSGGSFGGGRRWIFRKWWKPRLLKIINCIKNITIIVADH